MPSGAIITTLGLAKLASATPLNQLNISSLAVGDGNGGYPTLDPSMTSLTNEVWRGTPSPPIRDPDSPNVLIFEAVIPPSVGGFTVREQAIFDDAGDMIAIGQTSVVEKPLPNAATGVMLTVRLHIQLDNAEQVDLFFQDDPTISADNVSNANGGSVQDFIDEVDTLYAKISGQTFTGPISATGIKSLTKYGSLIIGDNPVGVTGADFPSTTSLRDAVNVSRKLVNSATDCHAFADKTIIENASDYGGYGAVDVTTILRGNNIHNHVAAYQDRFSYEGSGTLENSWGFILWPTAPGSGTVEKRVGIQLRGISTTTATVESNRGIDIDPKSSLDENIGVIVRNGVCVNSPAVSYRSDQNSSGYTFYTSSFGKMQQQGKVGFGGASPTSTPFTFSVAELGSTVLGSFSADSANGAFIASSGDSKISFISNLSLLGGWGNSTDSKCFYANSATQNLGKDLKRWGTVFLVTAPNVSSDERFKDFEDISDLEVKCASEVKKAIRKYRLKSEGVKIHFGVSAQEVVNIFKKYGLCATDYNIVQIDKDGYYSVCYEELLIFINLSN